MTVSVVPLDPHPASPRVRDRRMAVDKLVKDILDYINLSRIKTLYDDNIGYSVPQIDAAVDAYDSITNFINKRLRKPYIDGQEPL